MAYKPQVLNVAEGGTGRITLTSHGVLVGAGTSGIAQTAAGTSGQVLQSGGASADPVFSTATFPATATSTGTLLRADGTNWVATTSTYPNTNAVSTLLYASSANVMSALATANSGVLVTSGSGVPSILAAGTTGQVLQASSAGTPAWSTPTYPSASGSTGVILRSDGTNYVATTSTYPNTNAINTLLYASAANTMSALATANSGVLITSSGGVPSISSTLPSAVQGNITSTGNLGNQTNTTRSCFLANATTAVSNTTGDGTAYTVIFNNSIFDQGSNYNATTGVFTAPVTGKYLLCTTVTIGSVGAGHTLGQIQFTCTSNIYLLADISPAAAQSSTNNFTMSGSTVATLSANDTVKVVLTVSNSTKTIQLFGAVSSTLYTTFSAELLC